MDYETELKDLRKRAKEAQTEKIQAETRLQELQRQEQELIAKCQAKGWDPENLKQEQATREAKLQSLIEQIKANLPATGTYCEKEPF